MIRTTAMLLAMISLTAALQAQDLGRLQFKQGQTIQTKVEQTTRAIDTASDGSSELTSHVEQTRNWQVLEVDGQGTATLQLAFSRLMMQQKLPSGETWEYDSNEPDKGHQQLKQQLGALVNKPLAVIRVDAIGRVIEVKSVLQGSGSRYESELPFAVVLPGVALQVNQSWKRDYRIVLDPPLGTGEKFAAEQVYKVESAANGQAQISFGTTIKDQPQSATDRLPLLQMQPQGKVTFDAKRGLVTSIRLTSGGKVEGHAGEGSRYEFVREYKEDLVSP